MNEKNYKLLGVLLLVLNPYIYGGISVLTYSRRGYFAVGGEIFLPIIIFIVACLYLGVFDRISERSRQR